MRCPHCHQPLSEEEIATLNAQRSAQKRWRVTKAVSPSLPPRPSIPAPQVDPKFDFGA